MRLHELFTTLIPKTHWTKNGPMHLGVFEVNGTHYVIQLIKMQPNDPIHSVLSNEMITNNTWFFAFAAMINGEPVDTNTNKGDSIPVISVVIQTLEKFIQEQDIDVLYLGCSDRHKKLKSLYQRMITKYTEKHNWTVNSTTTGNFFGDVKFVWILKK